MVKIGDLFKKFKIIDTRISEEVLNIEVEKLDLDNFTSDDMDGETIILKGEYVEEGITPPNNIEVVVNINSLDTLDTVTIYRILKDNFTSFCVYDNEGGLHTIS